MTNSEPARRDERLHAVIATLRRNLPQLHGALIATADGELVAHDFPDDVAENVAAMAATTVGLGQRVAHRVELGTLSETIIRGSQGYLVVYAAGTHGVLALAAPSAASLAQLRLEARVAALEIVIALSAS